jgi:glycosyltransferase involved in cell wall biosynthesis
MSEDVRMLGKQTDMEDIYVVSDLFLLPSEYESFGLAALEAMAGGSPVIASDAGGLPEIITQGKNGFMSKVGDLDSMSKNAISILRENETLESFRKEARLQAARFDISSIVPKYEELYERVIRRDS